MTPSPTLWRRAAADGGPQAGNPTRRDGVREAAQRNAFTIDVEDYYQVHAFAGAVAREDWDGQPSRVEGNTAAFLDLLAERGAKGTFFVLGWIAERHPGLIRRIVAEGDRKSVV